MRDDHSIEDIRGAKDTDALGGMDRRERRQGANNYGSQLLNKN